MHTDHFNNSSYEEDLSSKTAISKVASKFHKWFSGSLCFICENVKNFDGLMFRHEICIKYFFYNKK